MAKSNNQKLKLLYLIKILEEKTNEEHTLNATGLIEELEKYGITAERKSIYNDINQLIDFGYDIINVKSRENGGYYMASREFELAELKLLVDAVQSSKFITQKKSKELIGKLEKLTSKYEAKQLQRQVYVTSRVKTDNESIYYNVDELHKAIQENRKIQFQYLEWNTKKQLCPRKNGEPYIVSPYALLWNEEKYYLVGYSHSDEEIRHYRVDKMGQILILDEKQYENYENKETEFDIAAYSNKVFGMYGGSEKMVTLQFPNRLAGVVIDRFGKDVDIRKRDEGFFSVRVKVAISGQFFGYLAGLGSEVVILSPESVKEDFVAYLQELQKAYIVK